MDKAPFDAMKFTDTVLKESKHIKLSLEADPLKLDKALLDPMPCPQIKYIKPSEAGDASIEQLLMWSQQLLQLEESLGINKAPTKVRGLNTTRTNKTFLHRSGSVPQLNQTKAKFPESNKVSETPKTVDIELTKQMLSEYCKKRSATRSICTINITLINGVCSALDDLAHLFADVKVEFEKHPVVEDKDNEELSKWLSDISQVRAAFTIYNLFF